MESTKDRWLSLAGLLTEAQQEEQSFDPDELDGLSLTPAMKKLLDPDISAQKYAALDAELDAKGTPQHQGFALAAFAFNYAGFDNDGADAAALLKKAITYIPKIIKARQAHAEKSQESEEK